MTELKNLLFAVFAIWYGIYLIKLVRRTRHNHEVIKALSDEDRQKLKDSLAENLNPPPEVAGAFFAVPWWVLPVILVLIATAIWYAVS